jgi:hypothetical protein
MAKKCPSGRVKWKTLLKQISRDQNWTYYGNFFYQEDFFSSRDLFPRKDKVTPIDDNVVKCRFACHIIIIVEKDPRSVVPHRVRK